MSSTDKIPIRCTGIAGALCVEPPSDEAKAISDSLVAELNNLEIFETPLEVSLRRQALRQLHVMCNRWIREKALQQNYPEHIANTTTCKIFTFGSYRLGINFRNADIDALCCVPRFITREVFFTEIMELLHADPNAEDLCAVVDAYVPILKMRLYTVEIDLLFARIDQMSIPQSFSLSHNTIALMRNMDEKDVRSINGVRVTEEILNLVYNKETFKTSLQIIRIWAKRRGIYSNVMGFLGGVTWAILVARICQLWPMATPANIVVQFFYVLDEWPWPKPVILCEVEEIPQLNLAVWNGLSGGDQSTQLMPVLTPCYPSQNSCYNVAYSNKLIIDREIKKAKTNAKAMYHGQKSWAELFKPAQFFVYKHYVVITVSFSDDDLIPVKVDDETNLNHHESTTNANGMGDDVTCAASKEEQAERQRQLFKELCGLVESKIRLLLNAFDYNDQIALAHPNPTSFGPIDKFIPSNLSAPKNGASNGATGKTQSDSSQSSPDQSSGGSSSSSLSSSKQPSSSSSSSSIQNGVTSEINVTTNSEKCEGRHVCDPPLTRRWFVGLQFLSNTKSINNKKTNAAAVGTPGAAGGTKPSLDINVGGDINYFHSNIMRTWQHSHAPHEAELLVSSVLSVCHVRRGDLAPLLPDSEMRIIQNTPAVSAFVAQPVQPYHQSQQQIRGQRKLRNSCSSASSILAAAAAANANTAENDSGSANISRSKSFSAAPTGPHFSTSLNHSTSSTESHATTSSVNGGSATPHLSQDENPAKRCKLDTQQHCEAGALSSSHSTSFPSPQLHQSSSAAALLQNSSTPPAANSL